MNSKITKKAIESIQNAKEIQMEYKGNTQEMQRGYKGNTKEIQLTPGRATVCHE